MKAVPRRRFAARFVATRKVTFAVRLSRREWRRIEPMMFIGVFEAFKTRGVRLILRCWWYPSIKCLTRIKLGPAPVFKIPKRVLVARGVKPVST